MSIQGCPIKVLKLFLSKWESYLSILILFTFFSLNVQLFRLCQTMWWLRGVEAPAILSPMTVSLTRPASCQWRWWWCRASGLMVSMMSTAPRYRCLYTRAASVAANWSRSTATNTSTTMSHLAGDNIPLCVFLISVIHCRCICENTEERAVCIASKKVWDPDTCQCHCPLDSLQTCPTGIINWGTKPLPVDNAINYVKFQDTGMI